MAEQKKIIDPKKWRIWDIKFRLNGSNVMPEEALSYEMENFFPSFVFIEKESLDRFGQEVEGAQSGPVCCRLAFLTHDGKPMESSPEASCRWYEIEPMNVQMVRLHLEDLVPSVRRHGGVEGYVVPLQESLSFRSVEDVNAYLHNLMFWESMVTPLECGPLMQRFAWIAQRLYTMRREQRDSVVHLKREGAERLPMNTDNTVAIVEAALRISGNKKKKSSGEKHNRPTVTLLTDEDIPSKESLKQLSQTAMELKLKANQMQSLMGTMYKQLYGERFYAKRLYELETSQLDSLDLEAAYSPDVTSGKESACSQLNKHIGQLHRNDK